MTGILPVVITYREGSQDALTFQLLDDTNQDGVVETPVDLTQATRVVVHQKSALSGTVSTFATDDQNPVVSFVDKTQGTVSFTPNFVASEFRYWIYLTVEQGGKSIAFPEDHELIVLVRPA